ncbi:glycosyltransferase family 25 protein [Pseudoalteromonas aurantia]|uniref:Glycosyl transferase, family 25 n=1 Tax=Pseudoalteromonas aurantia 208 TaxID=1314867 RepID=A0ABR9E927_9GAMM|nr:glycosyltransferase family 25 protein [Pseudoalteromonas aurantia]MBE0366303.1 glycosyl transferase, family 25 [Pseudoalteromonas aurantia 208]
MLKTSFTYTDMSLPIFVINMKNSVERWQKTYNRLQTLGLECQRFEATVGKSLDETETSNWYDPTANLKKHHRNMTPGEIGCYVSHMRIWQHMAAHNITAAIVLEDDLIIEEHLKETIEQVGELESWDMIKLSDNRANPFIESASLSKSLTLGSYLKVPNGTQGYAVSLSGAKKLLQRKPFFRPVDVDIQFHSEVELNLVGIKPYPISEDLSFESEIANSNAGTHSNQSTFLRNLKHRFAMYLQRKRASGDIKRIIKS